MPQMSPMQIDQEMDKRHAGFLEGEYELQQQIYQEKQRVWELEQKRKMFEERHKAFDEVAERGPYSWMNAKPEVGNVGLCVGNW